MPASRFNLAVGRQSYAGMSHLEQVENKKNKLSTKHHVKAL